MGTQTTGWMQTSGAAGGNTSAQRSNGFFSRATPEQVATGLGWFSIALGLGELLAPRAIASIIGTKEKHGPLLRLLGLRELAAGAMILSGSRAAGCWSRVAGDLIDLALLGADIAAPGTDKGRAVGSTAAVVGVTVVDALTAMELSKSQSGAYDIRAERSVTIGKSPEECYNFWRDFENLPRFMQHLRSVRPNGENRTHWIAKGPGGTTFEWDAEITAARPGECISWHTLEGADIEHSGSVHFERAAGNRGTIVRVQLYYMPPARVGGAAGAMIAKIFGQDPEAEIFQDLRRFKQILETGDVVTTEGQSAGRPSSETWLDKVARY